MEDDVGGVEGVLWDGSLCWGRGGGVFLFRDYGGKLGLASIWRMAFGLKMSPSSYWWSSD